MLIVSQRTKACVSKYHEFCWRLQKRLGAQLIRKQSVRKVQMAGIVLDDLQTVPDQCPGSSKWKDIVMPLAHDVLDVTIATVAGIVAVSVVFPFYLAVVLARTLVRRAKPAPTA
jgi:hypothetical protein